MKLFKFKPKDILKTKMARFTEMIKSRISEIDKVNSQLSVVLDETRIAIGRELDSIELSTVVVSGNEEPGIIVRQEDGSFRCNDLPYSSAGGSGTSPAAVKTTSSNGFSSKWQRSQATV